MLGKNISIQVSGHYLAHLQCITTYDSAFIALSLSYCLLSDITKGTVLLHDLLETKVGIRLEVVQVNTDNFMTKHIVILQVSRKPTIRQHLV